MASSQAEDGVTGAYGDVAGLHRGLAILDHVELTPKVQRQLGDRREPEPEPEVVADLADVLGSFPREGVRAQAGIRVEHRAGPERQQRVDAKAGRRAAIPRIGGGRSKVLLHVAQAGARVERLDGEQRKELYRDRDAVSRTLLREIVDDGNADSAKGADPDIGPLRHGRGQGDAEDYKEDPAHG